MTLSDFDYNLPPELIAVEPAKKRDESRFLVLEKNTGNIKHKRFFDLPDFLNKGDVLVLNNSKVFPARLIGEKITGGRVEVLLNKYSGGFWECLVGGRVKAGSEIIFSKKLKAKIEKVGECGVKFLKFNLSNSDFMKEVEKIGQVPLPPYIKKMRKEKKEWKGDKKNYQTIYADANKIGSVAAPTAGLHFTQKLLKEIKAKGVEVVFITLHVGLGTFLPVKIENIKEHKLHSEWAEISADVLEKIINAKKAGHKVFAVGTTTVRTLEGLPESNLRCHSDLCCHSRESGNPENILSNIGFPLVGGNDGIGFTGFIDIFICPPYKFKIIDGLITNFHLPKSSLMMLVSALAGTKNIKKAYQTAIKEKYRFYSYGDAMLIM